MQFYQSNGKQTNAACCQACEKTVTAQLPRSNLTFLPQPIFYLSGNPEYRVFPSVCACVCLSPYLTLRDGECKVHLSCCSLGSIHLFFFFFFFLSHWPAAHPFLGLSPRISVFPTLGFHGSSEGALLATLPRSPLLSYPGTLSG
ncbi:hypothetical protein LEMLEM_LOCUS14872 [Lemmus lemmus]